VRFVIPATNSTKERIKHVKQIMPDLATFKLVYVGFIFYNSISIIVLCDSEAKDVVLSQELAKFEEQ
jgi:hypothetical protein